MEKSAFNAVILFIVIFVVFGGLSINSFFNYSYESCSQGEFTVGCSATPVFSTLNFLTNIFYVFLFSLAIVFLFFYKVKWTLRLPAIYLIFVIFLYTSGKYFNDLGILFIILSPGFWIPSLGKINYILSYSIRGIISIGIYSLLGRLIDLFKKKKIEDRAE